MASLKNLIYPRSIGQRFAMAIGAGAGLILSLIHISEPTRPY